MSFHFLIDGYNLLHAFPQMPPGSWQDKREALLVYLKQSRPQGKNPATVVYDSREGLGDKTVHGDITVIFTAGETADDRISRMVQTAPNPRLLVVVSNDQGIRREIGGLGARFLAADEFLKVKPASSPSAPDKRSPDAPEKINEEFRKKWL